MIFSPVYRKTPVFLFFAAWVFLLVCILLAAHPAMAHMVRDDAQERSWHEVTTQIEALSYGWEAFYVFSGIEWGILALAKSPMGWLFSGLITLPVVLFNLWKYRTNKSLWRTAVVASAAAFIALCAMYMFAGPQIENVETLYRQFGLFTGYLSVLMVSWLSGWLMLGTNLMYRNDRLRKAGISALLISMIFQSVASSVWYITPLHQFWWD